MRGLFALTIGVSSGPACPNTSCAEHLFELRCDGWRPDVFPIFPLLSHGPENQKGPPKIYFALRLRP